MVLSLTASQNDSVNLELVAKQEKLDIILQNRYISETKRAITKQYDDYTLQLSDVGRMIIMVGHNDLTLTIPSHSETPIPVASCFFFSARGSGEHYIEESQGVFIEKMTTGRVIANKGLVSAVKLGENTWALFGNITLGERVPPDVPDDWDWGVLTITTKKLSDAQVGVNYFTILEAVSGTPVTWSIGSGSLPNGLTMTSSGIIYGNPTELGVFTFNILATNSDEQSATKTFKIKVKPSNLDSSAVTLLMQ